MGQPFSLLENCSREEFNGVTREPFCSPISRFDEFSRQYHRGVGDWIYVLPQLILLLFFWYSLFKSQMNESKPFLFMQGIPLTIEIVTHIAQGVYQHFEPPSMNFYLLREITFWTIQLAVAFGSVMYLNHLKYKMKTALMEEPDNQIPIYKRVNTYRNIFFMSLLVVSAYYMLAYMPMNNKNVLLAVDCMHLGIFFVIQVSAIRAGNYFIKVVKMEKNWWLPAQYEALVELKWGVMFVLLSPTNLVLLAKWYSGTKSYLELEEARFTGYFEISIIVFFNLLWIVNVNLSVPAMRKLLVQSFTKKEQKNVDTYSLNDRSQIEVVMVPRIEYGYPVV